MSKAKILIVEDEAILAMDLEDRLLALGYCVPASTASGEASIRLACDLRPDLILMDIKLQGAMTGIEAARQIRAQQDIPVIFISAYSDPATRQCAERVGGSGFLVKPLWMRKLSLAIETALGAAA